MANTMRDERQLMRQRGAGLRNADNVDFGLNLASKTSRDDRQLMRQRGAGNRKIDNIDFGFSFPTPTNSRRSSRTPRNDRRNAGRASKTPTTRRTSAEPSTQRSKRAGSTEPSVSSRERTRSRTPQLQTRQTQSNSSKRRRIDQQTAPLNANIRVVIPPFPLAQKPGSETFTIVEDHDQRDDDQDNSHSPLMNNQFQPNSARAESPLFVPQSDDKENEDTRTSATDERSPVKSAKADQASLLSNVGTSISEPSEISTTPSIEVSEVEREGSDTSIVKRTETGRQTHSSARRSSAKLPGSTSLLQSSPPNPTRRKKRKSILLGRKKRRTLHTPQVTIARTEEQVVTPEGSAIEVGNHLTDSTRKERNVHTKHLDTGLSQINKNGAKPLRGRHTRLSVSISPRPYEQVDEEDDEAYVEEEQSPEPITPAPKRRARPAKKRRRSSQESVSSQKSTNPGQQTFPILTHRLTNLEALPTIFEEDEREENSDGEKHYMTATFSDRAQPNSVDVLAQICRETVQSAITKLEAQDKSTASRGDIKRKRTALEAFGNDLDARLFDMSEAVENRLTLEARLRKSKREMSQLQAQWVRLRSDRDELALKADYIRRQNWENEEEGKRRWKMSELAHTTELELDKDVADEDNLEFMLKEVAYRVNGVHLQEGILDRIKAFNRQLEQLAISLERH